MHAVGMGTDNSDAVIGQALETLASQIRNTPETEIAEAISAIKTGTARESAYWFKTAMQKYPRQMQRYFGDQYMLVYRLYQGMMGSINADEGAGLLAYDLQQALKAYPDAKILAFTGVDDLLPVDGTLAARMQEVLAKSDEQLCPIVSLCGEWEYDGTGLPPAMLLCGTPTALPIGWANTPCRAKTCCWPWTARTAPLPPAPPLWKTPTPRQGSGPPSC